MTDESEDPRRAAVRRHNESQQRAATQKAQQQAAHQDSERRWQQDRTAWATAARQAIMLGVDKSNEAFRNESAAYTIVEGSTSNISVKYDIVPTTPSRIPPAATFTFALERDGLVHPDTTARGCESFPEPIAVQSVSPQWAEKVADSVMIAVLGGQRMRIPD